MSLTRPTIIGIASILVLAALMIACGGTTSKNEKTVTITISPTLASVTAAQHRVLSARVHDLRRWRLISSSVA